MVLDQVAVAQVHAVGSSGRSSGAWCWIKWPELRCMVLDQVAGAQVHAVGSSGRSSGACYWIKWP